jgi:uncharacterized membrane protein
MTSRTATLIGLTAILMWSLLAVLTVATGRVPAFQLAAMTFGIGALAASLSWIWRSGAVRALRQPPVVWIVGVGGLFGYHALYFLALRLAPPAEAGLLNYLWPLLIVLFSSLLPGERLKPHHIIGALLGLIGTVLLFAGNASAQFDRGQIPGADRRPCRGVCRRLRMGNVFGDVAQAQSRADRCGGRLLSRDGAARCRDSSGGRSHGLARLSAGNPQAPSPSAPVRISKNRNPERPCIRPASSRRCFRRPATPVQVRRPAALRPRQDPDRE